MRNIRVSEVGPMEVVQLLTNVVNEFKFVALS